MPSVERPWWIVLGVSSTADDATIRTAFKKLALVRHPDRGGSNEAMAELNLAYERALKHEDVPPAPRARPPQRDHVPRAGGKARPAPKRPAVTVSVPPSPAKPPPGSVGVPDAEVSFFGGALKIGLGLRVNPKTGKLGIGISAGIAESPDDDEEMRRKKKIAEWLI